jgi:PAS domain-containing protein
VRRGTFRDISVPLCDILGYSPEELIGKDYFSLIDRAEQDRLLNTSFPDMLRNVAFVDDIPIQLSAVTKAGKPILLMGTVNIVNDIPEPSFLFDVHETKGITGVDNTSNELN